MIEDTVRVFVCAAATILLCCAVTCSTKCTEPKRMSAAAKYVIVHHEPDSECSGESNCQQKISNLTGNHKKRGFCDIAYHFLVDRNGNRYKGRGWGFVGHHAAHFHDNSIGIAALGNFGSADIESEKSVITAVESIISDGVSKGRIRSDHTVLGHLDVTNRTECPGCLYQEVTRTERFCHQVPTERVTHHRRSLCKASRHASMAPKGNTSRCSGNINCSPRNSALESEEGFQFYSRQSWCANETARRRNLDQTYEFVIVYHTVGCKCNSLSSCTAPLQGIQRMHIRNLLRADNKAYDKFPDIGYNFLIDSAGHIYEGTGWYRTGTHSRCYNSNSLGVAFMGNFNLDRPNQKSLKALDRLIDHGINRGRILPAAGKAKVLGHRDVVIETTSPGTKLYEKLKTGKHSLYSERHRLIKCNRLGTNKTCECNCCINKCN